MRRIRRSDTRPERLLRSALYRAGLRYRKDSRIDAGAVRVRPDIVFQRERVAVFVDGCFWHSCPEHATAPTHNAHYWIPKLEANRARDQRATEALERDGWLVLRIWEHEDPSDAAGAVSRVVRQRRAK